MLNIGQNPPQRWPEDRPLADDFGGWRIAYTKPHNEKAMAWDFQHLGIGYYLPMITKRTRRLDNGKPRKSIIGIFPGYISFVDRPGLHRELKRIGRIVKIIDVFDQEQFICELDHIRRVIHDELDLQIHDNLAIGQRVVITSGPFEGIEGVITALDNQQRIYLNVGIFNRSISVGVESSILMPVS